MRGTTRSSISLHTEGTRFRLGDSIATPTDRAFDVLRPPDTAVTSHATRANAHSSRLPLTSFSAHLSPTANDPLGSSRHWIDPNLTPATVDWTSTAIG